MRRQRRIAPGPRAAALAVALAAAAPAARGQPDWLPPEVRQPADPFGLEREADGACADPLLAPIAPPIRESGLDSALDACLGGGVSAAARGSAVRDTPDLDGETASLFLELRRTPLPDLEIAAGARVIDRRFRDIAISGEEELAAGPVYLAAAGRVGRHRVGDRPLAVAWGLRLELPWTDTRAGDTAVVAASPQLAAALGLAPRLLLHGRVAALLAMIKPPDGIDTRRAAAASLDLAWAPLAVVALAAGLEAQTGWYQDGLDHLVVRGGLRVPLGCRARLHLGAAAPLAGDELIDAAGELSLTHDW